MGEIHPASPSGAPEGAKISRRKFLSLFVAGVASMALPSQAAAQQRPEEMHGDFPFPMIDPKEAAAQKIKDQEERLVQLREFLISYGFYTTLETTPNREQEMMLDDIWATMQAAMHNHQFDEHTMAIRRIRGAQSSWGEFMRLYPQMPKELGVEIDRLVAQFAGRPS